MEHPPRRHHQQAFRASQKPNPLAGIGDIGDDENVCCGNVVSERHASLQACYGHGRRVVQPGGLDEGCLAFQSIPIESVHAREPLLAIRSGGPIMSPLSDVGEMFMHRRLKVLIDLGRQKAPVSERLDLVLHQLLLLELQFLLQFEWQLRGVIS